MQSIFSVNFFDRVIELSLADITELEVDAIVNAANTALAGGGGVDGAIHRAAGPSVLKECRHIIDKIAKCKTGNAVITLAGNLKASYIIHTVGPVWHGGLQKESDLLESCYVKSIQLASENSIRSIAFPSISTGVYRYPKNLASVISIKTVCQHLLSSSIEKVIFCVYSKEDFSIYYNELKKLV